MRKKFIILFYLRFSVPFKYHTISVPSYFLSLHETSLLDLTEGVAAPQKLLRCRLLVKALKEVISLALGSLISRLTHAETTSSRVLGDHWDSTLNIFSLAYETSKSLFVFLYRSKKGIEHRAAREELTHEHGVRTRDLHGRCSEGVDQNRLSLRLNLLSIVEASVVSEIGVTCLAIIDQVFVSF